jgi:hypothetical protein
MTVVAAAAPLGAQEPDWNAAHQETLRHLQSIIRLNTVNPPGNELPVARYLQAQLDSAHIETHLFEPAPGRAALIARIKGNGSRKPVLVMGHMDVVGVERAHWSVDPFAAEIKDGYLYGRGAIDDKGMLAANLMTMLLLKREVIDRGGSLSRDVIFVANSDEEAGGGAKLMAMAFLVSPVSPAARIFAALLLLGCAWACRRLTKMGFRLTTQGVEVVDVLTTTRVPWDEVIGFVSEPGAHETHCVLVGEHDLRVKAPGTFDAEEMGAYEHADRSPIDELNRLLWSVRRGERPLGSGATALG